MADNYLEKQMEDFRSGKLGVVRRHSVMPSGRVCSLLNASSRVLVVASGMDFARIALDALAPAGGKMALLIEGSAEASVLTQQLGVRYYPQKSLPDSGMIEKAIADIRHCWHCEPEILSDVDAEIAGSPVWVCKTDESADEKVVQRGINAVMALAENGARMVVETGGYRFSRGEKM